MLRFFHVVLLVEVWVKSLRRGWKSVDGVLAVPIWIDIDVE